MSAEFVLDTPVVRAFVADVQATIAGASSPEEACEAIRPRFAQLLADPDWLPAEYQALRAGKRNGRRYRSVAALPRRATDRCRSSRSSCRLVRRRRSTTTSPGAWSASTAARRMRRSTPGERRARTRRAAFARRGDFYVLIPPRDDIHRVRTTSAETSVSIHLLTNDTGCVWRHAYDPDVRRGRPFRSGYVNVACND